MVEQLHHQNSQLNIAADKEKRTKFCINDHIDILVEILKRLDGRSLGVAASVCRLWCSITRNDSLWEHLCFRHVSPPPSGVRPVVVALGGYRRLYMVCLRRVLNRLAKRGSGGGDSDLLRRVWTRHQVELSLSLFCVDYYERQGGERLGDASASSLMFLCKPVNV
uniref:F-box domain-containing protein n=1 Tax=Davidia involucrata TaxID=16924 RepID=A0A5B7BUS2_DAVIN